MQELAGSIAKSAQVREINSLRDEVRELKKQFDGFLGAQAFTTIIPTLAPEPLTLIRDIPVVVKSTGEDFVATLFTTGISATGDTDDEAVLNLRDIIVQKFNILSSMPLEKLGPYPLHQLTVLQTMIRKAS